MSAMDPFQPLLRRQAACTRRAFLTGAAGGLGVAALASLLPRGLLAGDPPAAATAADGGLPGLPHFPPRVKHVIYLHQSGGPSQFETFDHKPELRRLAGTELPDSVRNGQRLTGMSSGQKSFPIAPSAFAFAQHGRSGAWISELLPHLGAIADDLCIVRSMHTEAINHDPAITFIQTGSQLAGRPSLGSWVSYGLGSPNRDLPAFVVLTSNGTGRKDDQPLYDRLWASGFLPTRHQGVKFRNTGDPVLFLADPPGIDRAMRRDLLDELGQLDQLQLQAAGDPEIATRIAQYELAFRMQASVPELTDLRAEPASAVDLYGPEARKPGTYAANCLLARRLVERGVRFVQLYHRGWDQHATLPRDIKGQCYDTDQASAALVTDLKRRGLLDQTLIIWGGEFGRTVYSQGELKPDNYGRDHHPRCFPMWLAGGGIKAGTTFGATDDFSYNIVGDEQVHVHDLNATILHLLGIDHTRLTYRFQGRDFRLTDVHGEVVEGILA
jgi:hypothetical protein